MPPLSLKSAVPHGKGVLIAAIDCLCNLKIGSSKCSNRLLVQLRCKCSLIIGALSFTFRQEGYTIKYSYNESEKEILMAEAAKKGSVKKRFTTEWSDRQGNIRRQLEKLGLESVESLMTNRAGSKARGIVRFQKFEKEIYDAMQEDFLMEIHI